MASEVRPPTVESGHGASSENGVSVDAHYQALSEIRRGICLLNAGQFDQAEKAFQKAITLEGSCESARDYLAACLIGEGRHEEAARLFQENIHKDAPHVSVVRSALTLAKSDRVDEAIETLRDGLTKLPENAELHFQLGLLLATCGQFEEAELRFEQAASIDREHVDALVNLGLCCGVRNAPVDAMNHLQRAQSRRPGDPKIGLLLAQVARTVRQLGQTVRVRATMPEVSAVKESKSIHNLAAIIERDPDLIEALLAVPDRAADKKLTTTLAGALDVLVKKCPERAEFHLQRAQAIERLGKADQAVIEAERAVALDPSLTRAMVELGRLYQVTNRPKDAIAQLEQATLSGARYADVYLRLGNLYRDQRQVERAREAYETALTINNRFHAAKAAIESLSHSTAI